MALAALAASLAAGVSQGQDTAARQPIGEPRAVQGLRSAAEVSARLEWAALPAGTHAAALRIGSPGAAGLRVAIRVGELPRAATLRFSSPDGAFSREVPAARVLDALARNRAAGESGPDARTWWSPMVPGDAMVLEIELPAAFEPAQLALAIPLVSHIRSWPSAAQSDASAATAVVTIAGSSYACAGFLAAARDGRAAAPYFLTGDDCVRSQSAASSLEAFWAGAASGVGSRLLYASGDSHVAFVSLDEPPAGSAALARTLASNPDPALEQWLGAGVAAASARLPGVFSSP